MAPENFPKISFQINSGETETKNQWVNLQIQTSRNDIEKISISFGKTCEPVNWQNYSETMPFDLGSENGERFISVKVQTVYGFTSDCTYQKIYLDTIAPTIASVEASTRGVYLKDEDIFIKINYNENVFVFGSPRLAIIVGSQTRYANYFSGSDSQTLIFKYTLQNNDSDLNGVTFPQAIDFNGGSITDNLLNSTSASLPPLSNSAIFVGCPTNFLKVPALSPYTTSSFCVSKYEMKIQGQNDGAQVYDSALVPEARASGTPWTRITRESAALECQSLGTHYDLINNGQWQSVARNIESNNLNWSGEVIGSMGGINRGHSDNSPSAPLEASPNDDHSCFLTEETCSLTMWHEQSRVLKLKSGALIWDFAGNVWEFVKDLKSETAMGADSHLSQVSNSSHPYTLSIGGLSGTTKVQFGPSGNYTALSGAPFGGLGFGYFSNFGTSIMRGGNWDFGANNSGIFATVFPFDGGKGVNVGFRCVFAP